MDDLTSQVASVGLMQSFVAITKAMVYSVSNTFFSGLFDNGIKRGQLKK